MAAASARPGHDVVEVEAFAEAFEHPERAAAKRVIHQ